MKQRIFLLIGIAALALVATSVAFAGTLGVTANVGGTAGISLNLPTAPSFSDTLDGTDQTVTYAPLLGVVDARGSGLGWNLTVSATNFSDGAGHSLAPGIDHGRHLRLSRGQHVHRGFELGRHLPPHGHLDRGEALQRGGELGPRQGRRDPDVQRRDPRQQLRRHLHEHPDPHGSDRPLNSSLPSKTRSSDRCLWTADVDGPAIDAGPFRVSLSITRFPTDSLSGRDPECDDSPG